MGQSQASTHTDPAKEERLGGAETGTSPPAPGSSTSRMKPEQRSRKRALVIGAGSSGLAAIQQALEAGLEPYCCEVRPGVGGAWRFDPDPGRCEWSFDSEGNAEVFTPGESDERGKPPPSPMYASLRTNVPTSLMQYRRQPFAPDVVRLSSRRCLFLAHMSGIAMTERF